MSNERDIPPIATEPVAFCYLCGASGVLLHAHLEDSMGNAPGRWSLKRCPNADCGLVWLDPRPTPRDIGKAYAAYFTHKDPSELPPSEAKRAYEWLSAGYLAGKYGYNRDKSSSFQRLASNLLYLFPAQRARLEFSVMYLPFSPGGRLLEVGCGSGRMLHRMERLGWQCEGIDFDPEAVRNASRKGLKVRSGELRAQRYADAAFDAVTMSHVIEHVYDPKDLLEECRRILKRGGRLVLVTPNARSFGYRLYGGHWQPLDPPRHLHLFTASALAKAAESVGFRRLQARTTIGAAHWVLRASRQIKARAAGGAVSRVADTLLPHVLQHVEWLLLKFDADAGEEIALVLEK
jgi:2-polyprenyl-3-methyl-5-hydroxy-6-metoxy-1,4-benzoquinol methylase